MANTITIILITMIVTYCLITIIQLEYNKYKKEKSKASSEILDLGTLKNVDISEDKLPHQELTGRKYLEDINAITITSDIPSSDNRQDKWQNERNIYGFDERDTWNLDSTMVELLYERVMMYKEICPLNLDHKMIEINGMEKTQKEWIDLLLNLCEKSILNTDYVIFDASLEYKVQIWTIWAELSGYMWW